MKNYAGLHGGISFEDSMAPQRGESSLSFLPALAIIPLAAQNGRLSLPIVRAGDTVREGQLVARRQGAGSANIHSTVPGKILSTISWNVARTVIYNSIVIQMEGSFTLLGKEKKSYEWRNLSAFELRELINDFGIVEMDGTGTPISDKISLYHKAEEPVSLVVRCVFDDPWLAADYALCKERIEDIAAGAVIAARAAAAEQIVISVSVPEKALGLALLEKISNILNENALFNEEAEAEAEARQNSVPLLNIVTVGSKYPQRNALELNKSLRQFEKKERVNFGAPLFISVSTLAAIYDALVFRKPALDRYVAVGGSAVRHPKVLKARVGTRLAQLFEECGGFSSPPKRIAIGSPLLGRPATSLDEPLTQASYAVFAVAEEKRGLNKNPFVLDLRRRSRLGLESEKEGVAQKQSYAQALPCIGCGECRSVCPVGLDPEDLYKELIQGIWTKSTAALLGKCHGCGCCEAICPSRLPLSRLLINPSGGGS